MCTRCGRPLSCSVNRVDSAQSSKLCAANVVLVRDILRFGQFSVLLALVY